MAALLIQANSSSIKCISLQLSLIQCDLSFFGESNFCIYQFFLTTTRSPDFICSVLFHDFLRHQLEFVKFLVTSISNECPWTLFGLKGRIFQWWIFLAKISFANQRREPNETEIRGGMRVGTIHAVELYSWIKERVAAREGPALSCKPRLTEFRTQKLPVWPPRRVVLTDGVHVDLKLKPAFRWGWLPHQWMWAIIYFEGTPSPLLPPPFSSIRNKRIVP